MYKVPMILDGDPGHDDAIAWVCANALDCFDILGITTVAGNQTIEKTTMNARRIAKLLQMDVPIAMGESRPILSEPIIAPNFHGVSGLDGIDLPEPSTELDSRSSIALLHDLLMESDEKVILVATGPLTNIGKLLLVHPECKEKIRMISIMGGGIYKGNWTPAAEFNILVDPEAADVVFKSGVPIQMCGLDVTEDAQVTKEDITKFFEINNDVAFTMGKWLEFFIQFPLTLGYDGAPLHDPCAVLSLAYPSMFEMEEMYVEVELNGKYTRGATVGDARLAHHDHANATVVTGIDREAFVEKLLEIARSYGKDEEE